ncbi:MAG: SGNH/GDSL hydrolase family protein [Candidatus Eisenbacteria bacterium]
MKNMRRFAIILAGAALIGGCQGPCSKIDLGAPKVETAAVDFSRYVAVGTSISAGYQSSGVVDRHQINSYPAIFARQIGKTVQLDGKGGFSEPTVNGRGLPPLQRLLSLSPVTIDTVGPAGVPTNTTFPTPYSNLAIPGAVLFDYGSPALYAFNPLTTLVLRGLGTVSDLTLSQQPTFVSFEFGANEVLGRATRGTSKVLIPQASVALFGSQLSTAITTLHTVNPNVRIALANVPDVTAIPFFTTVGSAGLFGFVHRKIAAPSVRAGQDTLEAAALTSADLVTLLGARQLGLGRGFSLANPLDSAVVLDEAERTVISANTDLMNAAIDQIAQASWIAKVDLNGTLANIRENGLNLGGTHYSDAFVRGGLFSLDGVHPTDLGHAVIANVMIDAVNQRFGTHIPYARMEDYATLTSSSARLAGGENGLRAGANIAGLENMVHMLSQGRQ